MNIFSRTREGYKFLLDIYNQYAITLIKEVFYKDRLFRFGFELVEYTDNFNGCEIEILDSTEKAQQEELVGRQIKYKGLWRNIEIRIANRWYASSKTCHGCGNVNKLLNSNDREWVCSECGGVIDLNLRDTDDYMIYKAS